MARNGPVSHCAARSREVIRSHQTMPESVASAIVLVCTDMSELVNGRCPSRSRDPHARRARKKKLGVFDLARDQV